nr:ATP-binding protein [Sphingomonas jejuensis]
MRNVTEVERPVHPATLLGTVRSALRARARQEETAAHLAARQAAEAELRALTQSLEARVAERTAELSIINAQLHGIRPGVDQVLVERVQIQQVLINLIRNAVDALEGCATRTIILAAAPCADGRVELSVSDTGPGFAPTAMAGETVSVKTSKPDGLGIGLSICRTILEEHGSSLVAVNNPTGGATIRFHLPGV